MAEGFISGSIAGAAGLVVGHPFDTIKVRIQTCNHYRGFTHCAKSIITNEGFRALFKGMLAPMASVSAMNAVFFGVYTGVLQSIDDDLETPKIMSTYIAGTASGFIAGFISGPTELVKCRLQVSGGTGRSKLSNIAIVRNIIQNDGFVGIFRGLGVTVFRELVSCGIYFATYEWLIQLFRGEEKQIQDLNPAHLILAGGLAGMLSWGINYPVDMVKSKLQTDGMTGPRQYTGTYSCFRDLRATHGWFGLYRGVTATLLRAFPSNAVMLPAYSISLSFIAKLRKEAQVIY